MLQLHGDDEPGWDDGPAIPLWWVADATRTEVAVAECSCPFDCPRDHENE